MKKTYLLEEITLEWGRFLIQTIATIWLLIQIYKWLKESYNLGGDIFFLMVLNLALITLVLEICSALKKEKFKRTKHLKKQ